MVVTHLVHGIRVDLTAVNDLPQLVNIACPRMTSQLILIAAILSVDGGMGPDGRSILRRNRMENGVCPLKAYAIS